ncbi:hypothetical protein K438DRAFT_223987 [Mycena galopus ATCC 62051]|nr:hypothetical protein K438DRAFT_223987 [Mycena galopus ATCC 62051]
MMHFVPPLLLPLLLVGQSVHAVPTRPEFYDPRILGGAMLNNASRHGGEPLNVIISGYSTPSVLTDAGFYGFAASLGFAHECLGLHMGARQPANLGDGNGWVDEITVLRESYGSASLGTCWETVIGSTAKPPPTRFSSPFRRKRACSGTTISRDGYNIGRDLLVQRAARARGTSYKGVRYATTARTLEGLMSPGKVGVNHNITTDGLVVLLTITVLPPSRPPASASASRLSRTFYLCCSGCTRRGPCRICGRFGRFPSPALYAGCDRSPSAF